MPSRSLMTWRAAAARALDEIEAAHTAVGGKGPGRRYATQQINQAYAVLLSSQFQRFCRDLHSEAVDHLADAVAAPILRDIFRSQLILGRKLDSGNPNPGNIGSDFSRLDMNFWPTIIRLDGRNRRRQERLEALNLWRNAIAHQDFNPRKLGGRSALRLSDVRGWRAACDSLVSQFDFAVAQHPATILGRAPW